MSEKYFALDLGKGNTGVWSASLFNEEGKLVYQNSDPKLKELLESIAVVIEGDPKKVQINTSRHAEDY